MQQKAQHTHVQHAVLASAFPDVVQLCLHSGMAAVMVVNVDGRPVVLNETTAREPTSNSDVTGDDEMVKRGGETDPVSMDHVQRLQQPSVAS